ncbi:hypothetical protein PsorP6_009077 [Peronosclerospora sorghi]|uniref:Uncharacterized protein n=1 Tax=Peronosclerospora sorghi TaxID=230839 RepID=A0ACC0W129_9STRA|nr:hypothetical protein PsorP6_009077 [Peronosclerospora sorghi]
MLVGASMASATGATMGAKLAVLRNNSIKFYSASMGSNFFLLSSTYIGKLLTLQIVAQLVVTGFIISDKRGDKKDWITGAAAGIITGGFYAGFVGGPFRGLQGATAGAAVGEAVFHTWRLSKGVQRYQSKYGKAPAIDHPTTALLVGSQGTPQKLAFPSLLPKSIKIPTKKSNVAPSSAWTNYDELRK